MNDFSKKNIDIQEASLGAYIKKYREDRSLNIDEIANKIGVKAKYLYQIESDDYGSLPKGVYSQIFFKKYINFLGIRHKNLLPEFIKEQESLSDNQKNIFFSKLVASKNFISFPILFRNFLLFVVILSLLFYLFSYFSTIFSPPMLEVYLEQDSIVINENNIKIEGRIESGAEVFVNGQLILADTEGYFSEELFLKPGVNIVEISAKKRYSKENVVTKQILVQN